MSFYSLLRLLRANVSNHQTNRGKPQKIEFAQTLQVGRAIDPKSCYAVSLLKYRAIIEKYANYRSGHFDSELLPNFGGLSSVNHAFNRPKNAKNGLNDLSFFCCLCQFDKDYLITFFRDNFFFRAIFLIKKSTSKKTFAYGCASPLNHLKLRSLKGG